MRQLNWFEIFRLKRFILVGRISWHALHMKCLTDFDILSFQIAFQDTSLALEFEVWSWILLPLLTCKAKVEFTENNASLTSHQVTLTIAPKILKEIMQMVMASSFVEILEINYISHVFVSESMRLATLALLSSTLTANWIWKVVRNDVQLSSKMCTFQPSLVLQSKPSLTKDKESLKLRQIRERLYPNLAYNSEKWKVFRLEY